MQNPLAISNLGGSFFNNKKNLSDKIASIRKEEEMKEANKIGVSAEVTLQTIHDYSKTVDSKTLQQTLSIVQVEIKDEQIYIYTPTTIAKETVQQQDNLMSKLREVFLRPSLSVHVLRDDVRFPDYSAPKVQKPLTDKEKYIMMVQKNPNVAKLQSDFDLNP